MYVLYNPKSKKYFVTTSGLTIIENDTGKMFYSEQEALDMVFSINTPVYLVKKVTDT